MTQCLGIRTILHAGYGMIEALNSINPVHILSVCRLGYSVSTNVNSGSTEMKSSLSAIPRKGLEALLFILQPNFPRHTRCPTLRS